MHSADQPNAGQPHAGRPRVAIIATTYFAGSHADVIGTRLIEGYEFAGERIDSRVEVVSIYLEQLGDSLDEGVRPDIGLDIINRNGVQRYPTVAEAIGQGRPGVHVDGVVIIGEHGDYEYNEYEQKLYPRRRLFDAAVATMIGAGRTVPIFSDKHLAWSSSDAQAMAETAERLSIPLLAGSSVPLAWRLPKDAEWTAGGPMVEAVGVGYGPTEVYGFHILEGLQSTVERRAGGESGVRSVRALTGDAAVDACRNGLVPEQLLNEALATFDLSVDQRRQALASVKEVFLLEYVDGLRAAAVNCDQVIGNFAVAARGPDQQFACQIWLQGAPHSHFTFLVRQIESLILTGIAPYPVERTRLTTAVLSAAMRSRRDGAVQVGADLETAYRPVSDIADTGLHLPQGTVA